MTASHPQQLLTQKIATTALAYYRQLESLPPTALELATWFDALAAPTRLQMHTLGLQACLRLPVFKRYVLEKRGYSMPAYMALHLAPDELVQWVDNSESGL
ncbi:hypothetical protein [Hymenobacter profundi]|uniref:Uncharacterized protein n=1 Tax=Hymenobacter profundi TaxID=1982110 RepID=A0ABS6X5X2_9BACT|nr:hypothetical protein [Hymenobacter profundi]MBW3131240.1 hypothetical protein [Hymenobacter profundi]